MEDCSEDDFCKIKKFLEKQHYGLFGNSSAVQICRWTRNSLNGRGVCWKEEFYGIECHRCCQMTPAVMWCENSCLHCWRPIEMNLGKKLLKIDNPKALLDGIIEARKKLMIGFNGNKNISKKKFEEATNPTLFTMSLSGEPTIYPRLGELFMEIRRREAISFLVTNGLNPSAIEKLKSSGLPTQITISTNASNERLFLRLCRPSIKNAWEKFNESLDVLKKLKGSVRRVVRLTLIKTGTGKFGDLTNMEDSHISEYVKLIKKADADFVHVKGFMSVGYARERLGYDKMPWHHEIKNFGSKLVNELNKNLEKKKWEILGEKERSCVIVIGRDKKKMKIKKV